MVIHPSSDAKSVFIREAACDVKSVRESVPRSLWETYSAFANTNGGTIVLGVVEDDEKGMVIEGVPDVQGTLNGLWNGLNNTEKVSANLLTDSDVVVTDVDGKELIVIRVPRADRKDRPLFINGNTRNSFRRNGEGDYRCTPDEINSMITDSMSGPTDRVPVNTSGISDFDPGTVSAFRNSMRTLKGEHPWNNLDDGEFLRVVGAAVDSEGTLVPTLAGLLMFGCSYCIMSESYNYHLDYREYVSDDEWSLRITSGDGDWSGNVFDFYIRVMNSLKTVTGRRMAIDDDMRRVEDTQLDKCMREMLVNALVNADYRGRGGILVEWRPRSFSVRNCGTFRIPLETAMAGGVSDPRNQTMATMFSLIGAVEHAGSGIHRILSYCKSLGLPGPAFTEEMEPARVTVRLSLVPSDTDKDILDGQVVSLLSEDGTLSISAIAERLNVPRSRVVTAVDRLKTSGMLTRVDGTRGRWVVSGRLRRQKIETRATAYGCSCQSRNPSPETS